MRILQELENNDKYYKYNLISYDNEYQYNQM